MRRITLATALGASALVAALAPPAQAGTMTNHTCRLPDGRIAPTSGWSGSADNAAWDITNHCAAGAFLKLEGKGPHHSSDESGAGMSYSPASGTTLRSATIYRAASLPHSPDSWGWSYTIAGGSKTVEYNAAAQAPGGNASLGAGSTSIWNHPANRVQISDAAALANGNDAYVGIRCSGLGGRTCADPGSDAFVRVYAASFVAHDPSDPVVSQVGGSLPDAGIKRGVESVTFNASDTGSGVYRALVEVDDVVVQTTALDTDGGRCADAMPGNADAYEFTDRQPCKLALSGVVKLDTRTIADGARSVAVRIEDATGNRTSVIGPAPMTIDNVPAPTSTSAPIVSGNMVRGSLLTTDAGGWDAHGAPMSLGYQWQRSADGGASWADIPGATGSAYTTTAADVGRHIRSRVTGTSSEGTTTAYSASAGRVTEPSAPVTAPANGVPGANGANGSSGSNGSNGSNGGGANGANGAAGLTLVQTGNGRDASPAASLAASFDGTRSKTIKVRYGKRRRITGTLRLPNGQPIVGARLDVTAQPKLMGALPVAAGHVVSDSRGRFAYSFRATTSRTITIGYRWYMEAASHTHTTAVNVQVMPAVSMKPSRTTLSNGQSVAFTGRIAGAPRGVRKVVEIQALDGRTWRTIATVRVSRRAAGKFAYRYRFTRTTRPTAYQFRAKVKAERGWPFLTGQSRSRTVKVLP